MFVREPHFAGPKNALTADEAAAYLKRIELSPDLANEPPSLKLLSEVLLAHHLQVPKDTSPLHVPAGDWNGPSSPIVLGSNFTGMPHGVAPSFHRIVSQHSGAFCFALNPCFAALLRQNGFRVSELATKCYREIGNNDPRTRPVGWHWGTITHEVLLVDWPGSDGRFLVDVGFGGGGCPLPVPFKEGATVMGLNPFDAWLLVHEELPLSDDVEHPIDVLKGWTLYRRVAGHHNCVELPITDASPGFWTPQFHFLQQTHTFRDFGMFHLYSSSHELASFTAFFLVTKLIPDTGGARRSLMFSESMKGADGKRQAKVHTTGGLEGEGADEGRDVEYVPMETGPMREYLQREFGFIFPEV